MSEALANADTHYFRWRQECQIPHRPEETNNLQRQQSRLYGGSLIHDISVYTHLGLVVCLHSRVKNVQ
jgi:hypothetical protein